MSSFDAPRVRWKRTPRAVVLLGWQAQYITGHRGEKGMRTSLAFAYETRYAPAKPLIAKDKGPDGAIPPALFPVILVIHRHQM